MPRVPARLLAAWLLMLSAAMTARADEPTAADTAKDVFASLYGKQVQQVMASADRTDDTALAEKLLEAARASEASPALLGLLCENAYTLGLRHPDGHATAVAAMELVAEKVPAQRTGALDKLVDFHQTQYTRARGADRKTRGDALFDAIVRAAAARIDARDFAGAGALWRRALPLAKAVRPRLAGAVQYAVNLAAAGRRAMQRAATLEKQLKENPGDAPAREALIRLHVMEFDDPAAAARYLPADRTDMTSRLVTVAGMRLEHLPERACRELGEWYRGLSAQASEAGKAAVLRRARGYYRRFLELHPAEDLDRTKVLLALKEVEGGLGAIPSLVALGIGTSRAAASGRLGATGGGAMSDLALVTRPAPLPGVASWTIETRAPRGFLSSVAFSPDGRFLAAGGESGTIRLFDAASGDMVRAMIGHNAGVRGLAFSPGGKTLASASSDRTVRLWEVATGLQVKVLKGHEGAVNAVAFSPDGKVLASASADKTIGLWDVATGRMPRSLSGLEYAARSVQFTPDGAAVLSGGYAVHVWDVATGAERKAGGTGKAAKTAKALIGGAVAVSPDGKTLAVGHRRGFTLMDLPTMTPRFQSERMYRGVSSLAYSANGKLLAVGSCPPTLSSAASGQPIRTLDVKGGTVDAVACSADGRFVAACVRDLRPPTVTLCVWDTTTGDRAWDSRQVLPSLGAASVSPDGKWLATAGGGSNAFRFWGLEHGVLLKTLEAGGKYPPGAVAWAPNSALVATASYGASVRFLNIRTGRVVRTLGSSEASYTLAWSPDGKVMATHQRKGGLELWNVTTGRRAARLAEVASAGPWSPDGRRLACPTDRGGVTIVDGRAGRLLRTLQTPSRGGGCAAWSPDGRLLAVGEGVTRKADFSSVYIYDTQSWQTKASMKVTEGGQGVTGLAWSRDGARLAAGDSTGAIHFWDAAGASVGRLEHPLGRVRPLAWLADGRLLAGYGRLVRLWDLDEGRPVRTLVPVGAQDGITFADSGHFAATAGVQVKQDFVYVVRDTKGVYLLDLAKMTEQYGWENDPAKLRQ